MHIAEKIIDNIYNSRFSLLHITRPSLHFPQWKEIVIDIYKNPFLYQRISTDNFRFVDAY